MKNPAQLEYKEGCFIRKEGKKSLKGFAYYFRSNKQVTFPIYASVNWAKKRNRGSDLGFRICWSIL